MMTIEPQLRALGVTRSSKQFWEAKAGNIADIFAGALLLKGLMRSCFHCYEHRWIHSGMMIDPQVMKQPHGSDRPGLVKFCVCPAIWLKESDDAELVDVCKADILPAKEGLVQ